MYAGTGTLTYGRRRYHMNDQAQEFMATFDRRFLQVGIGMNIEDTNAPMPQPVKLVLHEMR